MTKLSEEKLIELADQLENEQNLLVAILLGIVATIICASLWGMFSYFSSAIGLVLAISSGVVIGYVIREAGKGIHLKFSILAVLLTCCTVILAEMIAGAVEGALYYKVTPWEAFFYQTMEERWIRYWRKLTIPELASIIMGMYFSTKFSLRKLSKLQQKALARGFYSANNSS
ncbi:MAG: hypothetical protein ACJAS9_001700 [Polaribacter sp.]|jgi:hypothetical protein